MITVGGPVSRREWIAEPFINHILQALPGEDIVFVFVGSQHDPTRVLLQDLAERHGKPCCYIVVDDDRGDDTRIWNEGRYRKMAWLRNEVLQVVRDLEPDLHLSIDSDILLHPDAFRVMREKFRDEWAAIGSKVYLGLLTANVTNYCHWNSQGNMRRADEAGTFEVDALMALKLMRPEAYRIDYCYHEAGEDLGFSANCKNAGLRLGWTGEVVSKHVMEPELLTKVDDRVGF